MVIQGNKKKERTPARPLKSALSAGFLPLHQESEVLRPPGIVNLPIPTNVTAEDTPHAFFLQTGTHNNTSFLHLQASVSHWQERCT